MRPMPAWSAGLLAVCMTLGCQAPTVAPTAGDVPVQARLQLNTYRVQALVSAPTVADVDHVTLAVYRNGQAVEGATRTVAAGALGEPFALSRLRLGTTYEIRATAFADVAGTLPLSDAALSRTTFTTPSVTLDNGIATVDATPIAVSVPVKLVDRVYNGQAHVTVNANKVGLRRVQLTLFRNEAIVYQPAPYEVAALPASTTFTLRNLKPGVSPYRLQADGLNKGNRVVATASATFSTMPVEGGVEDTLGTIALTLN